MTCVIPIKAHSWPSTFEEDPHIYQSLLPGKFSHFFYYGYYLGMALISCFLKVLFVDVATECTLFSSEKNVLSFSYLSSCLLPTRLTFFPN